MTQFYKLNNKYIIDELIERMEKCRRGAEHYGGLCNANYKDGLKGWDKWCEKCIDYQKEWMRIRKALDYAMNEPRAYTYSTFDSFEKIVNQFIARHGKRAEKRFKQYYFDDLVFERLNKKFEKNIPKKELDCKLNDHGYRGDDDSDYSDEFIDDSEDFEYKY